MIKFLDGKKTYIVCAVSIVVALGELYLRQIDSQTTINMILAALGAAGFRSALTKLQ